MARKIPNCRLALPGSDRPPGLQSHGQSRLTFPRASILLTVAVSVLLTSCALRPEARSKAEADSDAAETAQSAQKAAAPENFQLIGKVKTDAFNDQATGEEVPADGGQIVTAVSSEPALLNDWIDNSAVTSYIVSYVYSNLLYQDPETYQWKGSLAERWLQQDIVVKTDGSKLLGTVSNPEETNGPVSLKTESGVVSIPRQQVKSVLQGASFTFYLKKGVKFHDGYPLTAADVKFSLDAIKDEAVDAPSLRNYFNDVEGCEILDDYTVRINYTKQYWQARDVVGSFEIMPKHIYDADNLLERDPQAFGKRFNESPYNRKPIGSGPYQFERWDTGLQIVLERNKDYSLDTPAPGHLDHLIFKIITDPVASLQALKNGDVDFLPGVTSEQFEKETSEPAFLQKYAKVQYYTGNFSYIGWNMRRPPFNDPRVRIAMEYGALDRQKFLNDVMYGLGLVVEGPEYYFGPAYDHSILPRPFDPEKAKQLLLEAGWYDRTGSGLRENKDGQPFRFELLLPSGSSTYLSLAAIMKENLRRLGIDMTVRQLEWATFLENVNDRQFDAVAMAWSIGVEDDPYQIWDSSQAENGGSNTVGFGTPATDQLIEQSRRMINDQKRRQMFFQLQRVIYEQDPYLFLFTRPDLGIYGKRYRGVKLYKVRPGYDLSQWYLPKSPGS